MRRADRRNNGSLNLSKSPSHLVKRCAQYYGNLYAREADATDLTKQQYNLLSALEHNEGVSQSALVGITGVDRSTLAEMVRRMRDKGLLTRERTEEDQRSNAVAISAAGRAAVRTARRASRRAEKALLEVLPRAERAFFVRLLAQIARAGEEFATDGQRARHDRRLRMRL